MNFEINSQRNVAIKRVAYAGIVCNIALAAVKAIIGVICGSSVLIADAAHSVSDLITDFGILIGLRYWSRPGDSTHPYGHGKIESLAGLGISLFLFFAAVGIIWDAIATIKDTNEHAISWIALVTALLSVVVKEVLFRWTDAVGHKVRSEAVIANAWHHRSDAFTSVIAVISIAVGMIWENALYVENIGAIVIAVILVKAAFECAFPALGKLVDQAPPPELRERIRKAAAEVEGVESAHAMRTRYIGSDIFVDMHVEVKPDLSVREGHMIATEVSNKLASEFEEVADVVVHIEPHEVYENEFIQ